MDFAEYRNNDIEKLRSEVGIGFTCYYSDAGLPEKLVSPFVSRNSDRIDHLRMRLVSSGFGEELHKYLTDKIGLVAGIDFRRHSSGLRGGNRYFDIESDVGISKLVELANRIGNKSRAEEGSPESNAPEVETARWVQRTARSDKPQER